MFVTPRFQPFLDSALAALQSDPRFVALLVAGSAVTGGLDDWSDLDLVAVVDDAAWDEVFADRDAIVARLGPLLVSFRADHVGEPRLVIALYDAPLIHVDVKFVAARDLLPVRTPTEVVWSRRPLDLGTPPPTPAFDPQWCADRLPAWVHYAAIKLGRGELFEVLSTLDFLRARVLGPLIAVEAGVAPRGVRRLEAVGGARLAELARTAAVYDRAALAEATHAAFRLAFSLLDGHASVRRHTEAEVKALAFLGEVTAKPPHR